MKMNDSSRRDEHVKERAALRMTSTWLHVMEFGESACGWPTCLIIDFLSLDHQPSIN